MSDTCNGIHWIYKVFADCIVTSRDKWSFAVGMISNLIWCVTSIPEIVTICRTKDIKGISPFLFTFLVIGDFTGLTGNILTGGLASQIITNIVYIVFDCTLLSQFIYYKCKNKNKGESIADIDNEDSMTSIAVAGGVAACAVVAAFDYGEPYTGESLIGSIFGWVSGSIYMTQF